jgi:flavin reductase (DIM6/NTAB) family NADH-FMN oxidoreductase RutF
MDTLDLRRAFGRFATGVTVITTRTSEGRRLGVTANSFNTVSLAPPIVLWSLSARAPSLAGFRAANHFAVHVLALDQIELSQRFAGPAPDAAADKFDGVELHENPDGLPLLAGCSARIMCRVLSAQAVGDHVLFLGQVENYAHTPATPLLFCNGQYQRGIGLNVAPSDSVYRSSSKGKP